MLAENTVKDVKDAVRTNLACLVRRFWTGVSRTPSSPALACEILCGDGEQMQKRSRRQDSQRAAQGAQVRASAAAFCGEDPLHDESRRVWQESHKDGRTESSLRELCVGKTLRRAQECERRASGAALCEFTCGDGQGGSIWKGSTSVHQQR